MTAKTKKATKSGSANKTKNTDHNLMIPFSFLVVALLALSFFPSPMDMKTKQFISLKLDIQKNMRGEGMYKCCLETPCTYCIEKTPKHGEGPACTCLKDIMEGKHPCGECMGEILEGHGNKYISEYFARAIADELGEQHLPELKKIISEKYGIPVEDQKS